MTFVARAFAKFSQIIFLVVAARLLTVDEFASYSYLLVLAAAFSVVSDTGVPLVTSRDIAAGRASPGELFRAGFPVVALSALAAGMVLPVFGAIDSGPGSTFVPVALTALFVVLNRTFDYVAASLRGVGRFNAVAVIEAIGAVVLLGGGIAVTVADLGVSAVLAVFCAKELGSAVIGYLLLRGDLDRPTRAPTVRWSDLLRVGIRLSIAGIALALVMRIPLAVLGNTGTTREVALFSAAQRFGDAAVLLATTCGFALLPGISLLARSEPERARRLVRRVLLGLGATSVLIAALVLPLTEPTMRLIFGGDYADGADLLRIFLSGLPSYTVLGVCWYAIIAFDDERRLLWIGLTGFFLATVAAAVAIPEFGGEGAAWTYVGAIYAMAAISLVALLHRLSRLPASPPSPHLEGAPALEISAP